MNAQSKKGPAHQPTNNGEQSKESKTMEATIAAAVKAIEGWNTSVQSVGVKKEIGLNTDGTKKYEVQEVGKIVLHVPSLAAFGIKDAVVRPYDKEQDGDTDDGLPKYTDQNLQWLYDAALAQVKVQARNKLINGTADMKDGQKIAENFMELTAEGERKGNAEALKLAKEAQQAFTAFMGTLGKKVETVAFASNLFRNRDALASQPKDMKEKMKGYLGQFVESLSAEDAERYTKPLTKVEEAASGAIDTGDF